jgi:hypothetical protein
MRKKKSKEINNDNKLGIELDRYTIDYLYDKVAVLIEKNFDNSNYSEAKDMAFRQVVRIFTDLLNG